MMQPDVLKAAGDLLTVDQFAALCDVSPRTIERWLQERRIDSIKLGGAIRIPKVEVIRMMSTGYRTRAL
jgi:excisionase family DNA binding protein